MKNRFVDYKKDIIVSTTDNQALDFLRYCLDNDIETSFITQRMHFFTILDGIPIGGQFIFKEDGTCEKNWFVDSKIKEYLREFKTIIDYTQKNMLLFA